MKKLISICFLLFAMISLVHAENTVEMAEGLYSSGKIYVVVACIAIIVVGIFIYLFSMDRRIKKVENNFKEKK